MEAFANQNTARVFLDIAGAHACLFSSADCDRALAGGTVAIAVSKWTDCKTCTEAEIVFPSSALPANWQSQNVTCFFQLDGKDIAGSPFALHLKTGKLCELRYS